MLYNKEVITVFDRQQVILCNVPKFLGLKIMHFASIM